MLTIKRGLALLLAVCMILGFVLIGEPASANAESDDPYIYILKPDASAVPDYYEDHAKPFVGWSPHEVGYYDIVRLFNIVNMDKLIENQADAPAGAYASVQTFCVDEGTTYRYGFRYRRLELEEGHFSTANGYFDPSPARHIRAIVEYAVPNMCNPSVIQQAANAYLSSVDGSNADLVYSLTVTELVSAIQAAIWSYSNAADFTFSEPYCGTADFEYYEYGNTYTKHFPDFISENTPVNVRESMSSYTSDNINGVYRYLRSLPEKGISEEAVSDNSIFLDSATIIGSGDNCILNMTVGVDGTIDSDDELVLTAKCGSQTKTVQLTDANEVDDGLYAISFTGVSQTDCAAVELRVDGIQRTTGAFFFEAEPRDGYSARRASQGFTGYCTGENAIQAKKTLDALAGAVTTELTKLDEKSGNPLSGVAFDLYRKQSGGDVKVGTFTTDENGKIAVMVTDSSAEYYFVEAQALPGYEAITGSVAGGQVTNDWPCGSLQISKILSNTTPAVINTPFNFTLTLDLSTAAVAGNDISWMTDDYFVEQLVSSKTLTWSAAAERKLTATFTLDAGESITVDGIPLGTTYTVEEILTAEEQQLFNVTAKIGDSIVGTTSAQGSVEAQNAVSFTNSVVTNDVKVGELSVSKELINTTPAEVGETFHFTITIDFSTAEAYKAGTPWMNDEYLLGFVNSSEDLTWTAADGKYTAQFTVDAGETVTIGGLALGTTYTVEEIQTEEDRLWFNVTTTVGEETTVGSSVEGSIAEKNAVLFTNSVVTNDVKVGELAVSKELINTTPAEVGETFHFIITIDFSTAEAYKAGTPWMNDEYLLGFVNSSEDLTWTAADGKYTAEFTVDAGETVTIGGLALGTTYTVEEIQTEEDRLWFNVTTTVGEETTVGSSVEGSIAEKNAIIFTNSVVTNDVKVGELAVSKELINTTPAEVGETFHFTITIDFSTAEAYKAGTPWMNDEYLLGFVNSSEDLTWTAADGKYTAQFTVDAGETVTIGGLALGTTYTVEEIQTEEDRLWFNVTTTVGEETTVGSSVEGSIAEKNAVLFTNSVVTNDVKVGELSVSKELINTTPAEVGETFHFIITIDFSTADAYKAGTPWMNDEYLLGFVNSSKDLTWTAADGKYTAAFTVDAGETVTIRGIALGTTYTVEEILTAEERELFTVTTTIGEETKSGTTAEGSVAEKNAVLFTNDVIQVEIPETGDPGVGMYMMLCILSVLGGAILMQTRRRFF